MVCVDESKDSLAALEWALKEVVRTGDAVQIVHAVKLVNAAVFMGESERNEREQSVEGEWVILDLFALAAASYLPANVLQEMEDQQRKLGKQIVQNAIRRCQQEKVLLL